MAVQPHAAELVHNDEEGGFYAPQYVPAIHWTEEALSCSFGEYGGVADWHWAHI